MTVILTVPDQLSGHSEHSPYWIMFLQYEHFMNTSQSKKYKKISLVMLFNKGQNK